MKHFLAKPPHSLGSSEAPKASRISVVRGLGCPEPTLESALHSPPQGSFWHRFNIDSTSKWGQDVFPRKTLEKKGKVNMRRKRVEITFVRCIRHRPPGPHPRIHLALPSSGVDLASIQHRFDINSTLIRHRFPDLTPFRCRINVKSMPNRPLRRGGRGGFEGGVRGLCLIRPSQN